MTARILLTGSPGSGKSTAVMKTVDLLERKGITVEGFLTQEVRQAGRRVGFDLVPLHGPRRMMAREGLPGTDQVGRYGVDVGAVDEVANDLQERLGKLTDQAVVILDEVGRMELYSSSFCAALKQILEGPWCHLITLTKARVRLAQELLSRRDLNRFDLDEMDREQLPGQIVDLLVQGVGPAH